MTKTRLGMATFGLFLVMSAAPASVFAQGAIPPPPAPPERPSAQPDAKMLEARQRYDRGLGLFADKNFEAARLEFARAYDLAPSYRILYNIGVCDAQLNDYVSATRNLEQYLAQGESQVPADRRKEVLGVLADLKPKIGHLTVTVEPGATITVDDVQAGIAPLAAPIDVNPGRRKVVAAKSGRLPATRSVLVAGSETVDVRLEIEAPATRTVAARDYLPVILWGGTVALTASAVVTGLLSLKASNDLKTMDSTFPETSSQLEDQRSKMRTFGVAADSLAAAAIVCGGAALYFTFKTKASGPVEMGFQPGGATLRGTF